MDALESKKEVGSLVWGWEVWIVSYNNIRLEVEGFRPTRRSWERFRSGLVCGFVVVEVVVDVVLEEENVLDEYGNEEEEEEVKEESIGVLGLELFETP